MATRLGCKLHGHIGTFQYQEEILLTGKQSRVINHYQCINCGTRKEFHEVEKKEEKVHVFL